MPVHQWLQLRGHQCPRQSPRTEAGAELSHSPSMVCTQSPDRSQSGFTEGRIPQHNTALGSMQGPSGAPASVATQHHL